MGRRKKIMGRPHKYAVAPAADRQADGIVFASKAEMRRYLELRVLERAGAIADLTLQERYPIAVNGAKVAEYVADFSYWDGRRMRRVVEDVKGVRTPVYGLKKRLMRAALGIEIEEVSARRVVRRGRS